MKKREYVSILVNAGVKKEVAEKALLAIDKDKRKELPKKGDVRELILRCEWRESGGNGGHAYWSGVCKSISAEATYDLTELPKAEKPRTPGTIMIGDVEVPEPMRVAPALGSWYWAVVWHGAWPSVMHETWDGYAVDTQRLKLGMCQSTEAGAIAQREATIKLYGGVL